MARSGRMLAHSSNTEFMIFSNGPEQNPAQGVGQTELTTVPSGPQSSVTTR